MAKDPPSFESWSPSNDGGPSRFRGPWFGPPNTFFGEYVPFRHTFWRGANLAVALTGAVAYPQGVRLDLSIRARDGSSPIGVREVDPLFHSHSIRGGTVPNDLLLFGVELNDTYKVTNLEGTKLWNEIEPPQSPTLIHYDASGQEDSWDIRYWLWPLPSRGAIVYVLKWASRGVPVTRVYDSADSIVAAASRSERVWLDDAPPDDAIIAEIKEL